MKEVGIESARQDFQFCGIKAPFDPALSILFGIDEHGVELPVEPMHVTPRDAFQKAVLGKDADVLRKVGVINAAGLQVEHLGGEQPSQSNRAGRADDDLSESFPLDVIQHLQNWRETQFLEFVFRQLEFADGREVFDWDIGKLKVTS